MPKQKEPDLNKLGRVSIELLSIYGNALWQEKSPEELERIKRDSAQNVMNHLGQGGHDIFLELCVVCEHVSRHGKKVQK